MTKQHGPTFFGLMYVPPSTQRGDGVNLSRRDRAHSIYIKCAENLAASLQARGYRFVLATNEPDYVRRMLEPSSHANSLELTTLNCTTHVPENIHFHSAHFKLDLFRHISHSEHERAVVVDLDMRAINTLPEAFKHHLENTDALCAYDITSQMAPYCGDARLTSDLTALTGLTAPLKWYGGEFLCGTKDHFASLYSLCHSLSDSYFAEPSRWAHQGDETLVNAALRILVARGTSITDIGAQGFLARYWSARTTHKQIPLAHALSCPLIHLPSDKEFLATNSAVTPLSSGRFRRAYRTYLLSRPLRKLWEYRTFKH
jgi:hypothetical protein